MFWQKEKSKAGSYKAFQHVLEGNSGFIQATVNEKRE